MNLSSSLLPLIKQDDCTMEIGTWSNAMAANIEMNGNSSEDEWNGMLPPNISICSRNKCKMSLPFFAIKDFKC